MRQIIRSIFLLSLIMTSFSTFGQKMKITGTVYDSTGVRPAINAMVMAVRMKDSLLLGHTRTGNDGSFILNSFDIDTFSLIIDHPHFDEKTYYMFGHAENQEINIPSIKLAEKAQEIQEVVIYANRNPIFYRGDTLVFVADSFQTHEGAVAEDLLKKLPGIQVDKDGKITMGGEEISQVLVDGDEFFGTDPTIATKNLGADGIAEVQVYEKENDDGIGGDDEKIQVLDLKLKDDAKNGYFGRITGASDFALTPVIDGNDDYDIKNSFYEGEVLLNKFKGAQKLSVFALTTNTPRSSFARGDMSKFGLSNEDGANGDWWDDNTRTTSGIPRTFKAGVYYSDKIGKKKQTKIGANYSYYNTTLDASSASRSQYFLTDTTYISDDSTRNYTANESHRINLSFESKLDSLTTLTIKPSFRYDEANSESSDITDYQDQFGNQTIGTRVDNDNVSSGYRLNGKAVLNRKFMKPKRELEFRYDMVMIDNQTDGYLNSETRYINGILPDSLTDQEKVNDNGTMSHYGTVTYIEPIGKRFKLETEYLYEYGFSMQNKETFDNAGGGIYDLPRADLSNNFENTRQQHRGGLRLIFEQKKHTISGGVRVRNIDIDNINLSTQLNTYQNITNVLPRLRYKYQAGRGKRFVIEYRTTSDQPQIDDLQPVPDNTNPNRLKVGNQELKPNYNHRFEANFRNFDVMSGSFTFAGANLTITDNAFTDSTSYDAFGRTNSKTVNVDGNKFGFLYGGVYFPLFRQRMTVQPMLVASYIENTNFISGIENTTTNYSIQPQVELGFKFFNDSLEIGLDAKYAYNNAISTLTNKATPSSVETYGANFTWVLPKGFKVGLEGTYNKNTQSGVGYDTEFFVLNAELSKRFLKTQNLELSLLGNDILNQNITANREVAGNIITDYRTVVISRYFLLRLTLRFNNRKTKEDDFKGMH